MALLHAGLAVGVYVSMRVHDRLDRRGRLLRHLRRYREPTSGVTESTPEVELPRRTEDLHIASWGLGLSVGSFALPVLAPAAYAVTLYAMLPMLRESERLLFQQRLVSDDLVSAVLSVTSLGIGQPLAASVQSVAYHFADVAILRSRERSRALLTDVAQQPERARLWRDGAEQEIDVAEIQPGDMVIARAGEIIPVDGRVLWGSVAVDQHRLTGESAPRVHDVSDTVYAGTLVLRGEARIEVTVTGRETALARIQHILRKTADHTSSLELKAEKIANAAALPLIGIAAAAAPLIGPSAAVGILYSAPINAVRAANAVLISRQLAKLVDSGILIKDGRSLEVLVDVDTLLFDKTGTLTSAELAVGEVTATGSWDANRILASAAAAEGKLDHPLARTLVAAASARSGGQPIAIAEDSAFSVGHGVTAHIDGHQVLVGGRRHLSAAGIALDEAAERALVSAEQRGASAILVATDDRVQGVIAIEAVLRPEARRVVEALRRQGIDQIILVSGDTEGPTSALADALDLDESISNALPDEKGELVRRLQAQGRRVCFVGDGVNDALAMKHAKCAISLHGASAVATDSAGIILLDGDLTRMDSLLVAAHRQRSRLRTVLGYWGAYAVINVGLTVGLRMGVGHSSLFFGTAFAIGSLLAVPPRVDDDRSQ